MLDLVKKYFSQNGRPPVSTGDADSKRILVATCALLLEMAAVDDEFSDEEQDVILSILRNDHHLSLGEANEILNRAHAQRERSIDLWQFTNLINRYYPEEDKIRIMEMIWKVIYADGRLNGHEDYLVHNLANLLRLSHAQLIDAKRKVKECMDADCAS
jgi:uncharacterized tellurite resistance protein B-like protein